LDVRDSEDLEARSARQITAIAAAAAEILLAPASGIDAKKVSQ
jgi:hypothetical protein